MFVSTQTLGITMLTGHLYACAVTLQDKQLRPKKAPQHHAWRFESGAYIEITWDQYKAGLGNTVTIQTGGQPWYRLQDIFSCPFCAPTTF